jgi:Ca2+-binding RTX toxin-like protein
VTLLTGTSTAEILTGTGGQDSIVGGGGADTINGGTGADVLVGGAGADSLDGGAAKDVYRWTRGDGNDLVNDSGASHLTEDRLVLTDVASADLKVSRGTATGATNSVLLSVTTGSVTEVITLQNMLVDLAAGTGIEEIAFSDGVVWDRDQLISAMTFGTGTGNDIVAGTTVGDSIQGWSGGDSLSGLAGNDTLIGGVGNDSLLGGEGADRYVWNAGDGADIITDTGVNLEDGDILDLGSIASSAVLLSRAVGTNDLLVSITTTSETRDLRIKDQFLGADGKGIEAILMAGGVRWNLEDIIARSSTSIGSGNDSLIGTTQRDQLNGLAGNDTLVGNAGDDTLTGGLNNDSLVGGAGNDRFIWSSGDGIDTINMRTAAMGRTRRLRPFRQAIF